MVTGKGSDQTAHIYWLICCFAYRIFHIIKYNLFNLFYNSLPSERSSWRSLTRRPVDPSTHPRFIFNCNLFYPSLPSERSSWRSLTRRPIDPYTHPRFILNCNLFYPSLPSEPSPWQSLTRHPVDLPFHFPYIPIYLSFPTTQLPVDPSTCRPVNLST